MAERNNKESDTIRQQRKAREEFLELKRMQSGEISAPPPPGADSVAPKTFREKSQNFWFYNRFAVIGVIFLAIVLFIGIRQCASREKYDMSIVLYTSTKITDTQTDNMAKYFEKFCDDTNDDGKVKVSILNCSYTDGTNNQISQASDTKLQAILVSEPEITLFILDDKTLERLNSISTETQLFSDEGIMLGESFYKSSKDEFGLIAPEGLRIVRRNISGTVMQDNDDAGKAFKSAGKFLEKLSGANK